MINKCYNEINNLIKLFNIDISYSLSHLPVYNCESADDIIGNKTGGLKNLLIEKNKNIYMCVILSKDKLDFKKIRNVIGGKSKFFQKELGINIIGCDFGAFPPFGFPKTIGLLIDEKVYSEEIIYFNPGINTKTIGIKLKDYKKIVGYYNGLVVDIT